MLVIWREVSRGPADLRVCAANRAKVSRYPIRDTTHRCSMVVRKISRGHTGDRDPGDIAIAIRF